MAITIPACKACVAATCSVLYVLNLFYGGSVRSLIARAVNIEAPRFCMRIDELSAWLGRSDAFEACIVFDLATFAIAHTARDLPRNLIC